MIVVSDTSALTALFLVQQLELLPNLYGTVIVPTAVMDELLLLETDLKYDLSTVKSATWLSTVSIKDEPLFQKYRRVLDEGESQALVLAKELAADLLLIDEMRGRAVAKAEGIPHTGVLGILLSAKAQGLLTAVQPVMNDLKTFANFYISEQLYKRVLDEAGE